MSETNLNDIFSDVPNATPMGENDELEIDVCNRANGASRKYKVFPENPLSVVLNVCRNDLGLANTGNDVVFEFNGKTTSDPAITVAEFGLVNGGKLLINPNAKVA